MRRVLAKSVFRVDHSHSSSSSVQGGLTAMVKEPQTEAKHISKDSLSLPSVWQKHKMVLGYGHKIWILNTYKIW